MTHALRVLDRHGIDYTCHEYRYVDHGGTSEAARQLGVDEHTIIKTLVFGETSRTPVLMLMHGDAEVSAKALARALGARSMAPCTEAVAERATGYQIGGISPFGTRQPLPVYVEASILDLPRAFINAGRRGLLVALPPDALLSVLSATPVHATGVV
jgi:Cys-tRNA(Pro) deacylase